MSTFLTRTGKEFDAFEINGKKHAIGDSVTITEDSAIKLLWNTVATPVYTIIDGANAVWTKNTDEDLTFTADGDFSLFTGVKVDDTPLTDDQYTAVSGSTVVTLNADYLDTLSIGKHRLTIVYSDGECSTDFEIKAAKDTDPGDGKPEDDNKKPTDNSSNKDTEKSPQTGDSSNMTLWFALLAVSAFSITGIGISQKRKKAK